MAAWCSSFIKELSPRLIGLTSCAGLGLSGVLSRRFLTQENPKPQTTIAPIAPLDPKKITPLLASRHSYAALSFAIRCNPAGLSRPEVLSLAEKLATQDPDINDRSARARLFNDLVSTYPEVLTADTIVQILKDPRSLNFLVHLQQLRNFPDLKLAENLRPLLTLEAKTRTLFAPKEAAPSGLTNPHSREKITFFPIDIDEHAHHSPS